MRIVLFHPVMLPPLDYGGVERVVLWLAKGLVELGHEVWIGAREGSRLPTPIRLLPFRAGARRVRDLISVLPPGTDIVHFHAPPESEEVDRLPCPWVLTVHGNGKPGEEFPLNSVFLTQDHASRHGAECFVFNGIDPSEYLFAPDTKTKDFVFLSKTSWNVKNVDEAIRLCRKAGVRLRVAGGNRPWGPRFRSWFSPSIDWVGPVAGACKATLLSRAQGLVFPVRWPEPFGLVMVEAMISGTPVLGPRIGSVPEVLQGEAGFPAGASINLLGAARGGRCIGRKGGQVSDFEPEWLDSLRQGFDIADFERAREWAMQRYHYIEMAKAYLSAYTRVRAGERLNPRKPLSKGWQIQ